MRTEGGKGKRKKKRKEKENGGKMGIKIVLLSFLFYISPCACFFIRAVVIFQIYKENYI